MVTDRTAGVGRALNSCGSVRTVVDLNLAKIFVLTYGPYPAEAWNLLPPAGGCRKVANMSYCSRKTLPMPGDGDIVPVDDSPEAGRFRSGPGTVFPWIAVARLVTLELEDRRR